MLPADRFQAKPARSCLVLLATVLLVLAASAHADRIAIVVDNSGSMRLNDAGRLVPVAVTRFVESLPPTTEVSLVSFDTRGRLIQPPLQAQDFDPAVLDHLDYRGAWTDLAAAVERGLYELRAPSRPGTISAIVMITDGIMDTGSPEGDLRAEAWLAGGLQDQMMQRNISFWVVALSEEADFRVLNPVTKATGGNYHRAMTAADVGTAMGHIRDSILRPDPVQPPTPEPLQPPVTTAEPATPAITEAPAVAVDTAPAVAEQPAPVAPAARNQWRWWLAGLLLLAGGGLLLWSLYRVRRLRPRAPARSAPHAEEYFPDCYLVDLHGVTGSTTHPLAGKYNMVTRLLHPPEDGMHYIQIFRRQIGRRHALIEYRDFSFWIIDQQSVNGTFLNGRRVLGETRLKHGDRLRFYKYEFEYCVSDLAMSNETLMGEDASTEG